MRRDGPPFRDHLVDHAGGAEGNDPCHGTSTVGYLQALASDHPPDDRAGVLSKFANSHSIHVLHSSTWARAVHRWPASTPAPTDGGGPSPAAGCPATAAEKGRMSG